LAMPRYLTLSKPKMRLGLRFKTARSTVDIDLTMGRISDEVTQGRDVNQVVREMLQVAATSTLVTGSSTRLGLS
jgi:hypothetical protein